MKPSLAPLLMAGLGLALLPGLSLAGANADAKIQRNGSPKKRITSSSARLVNQRERVE